MASDAAYEGDLERMILSLSGTSSSSPVDLEEVMLNAVASGSLPCVRYLWKMKFPWHRNSTASAAYHGDLAMLEYSHKKGAVWHESTTVRAAEGGHVDCFKYAEDHGAPHNIRLLLTCLKRVHLCPQSKAHWDTLLYAVDAGYTLHRPAIGLEDQVEDEEEDEDATTCKSSDSDSDCENVGWSVGCNEGHGTEDQMNRHEWASRPADVVPHVRNDIGTLEAVSRELHMIRLIQRAWRSRRICREMSD